VARTIPNTCPSCGKRPYPYGRPCEQCGFHGIDKVPISPVARRLLQGTFVLLGLLVLWAVVALFRLAGQFPV
jgi:hypothetical protein